MLSVLNWEHFFLDWATKTGNLGYPQKLRCVDVSLVWKTSRLSCMLSDSYGMMALQVLNGNQSGVDR